MPLATKTKQPAAPTTIDSCEPFRTEKGKLDSLVTELRSIDGRLAEIETAFDDATGKAEAIEQLQSDLAKAEAENATTQTAWMAFRVAWHRNRTRDPGAYPNDLSNWQKQRKDQHNELLEAARYWEGRVGRIRQQISIQQAKPRASLAELKYTHSEKRPEIESLEGEQTRLLNERRGLEAAIRTQRTVVEAGKRAAANELRATLQPQYDQLQSVVIDKTIELLEAVYTERRFRRQSSASGAEVSGNRLLPTTITAGLEGWAKIHGQKIE